MKPNVLKTFLTLLLSKLLFWKTLKIQQSDNSPKASLNRLLFWTMRLFSKSSLFTQTGLVTSKLLECSSLLIVNQTRGQLGQVQGMVLDLFLKRIWKFGLETLIHIPRYLAATTSKGYGLLITFFLILQDYPKFLIWLPTCLYIGQMV